MEDSIDYVGYQTLEVLSDASKFNQWMYSKISTYIGNKVLEIGSGIGNITSFIKANEIIASDFSEEYVEILKDRFHKNENVKIEKLDLLNEDDFKNNFDKSIDTVICLNVLEHVHDDHKAINNIFSVLSQNGQLILLVPYSQFLYCDYDVELGHYRRYSKGTIKKILESNGFEIEKMFLFNLFGGLGWYITGKILKRKKLSKSSIDLYERFVPLFRIIERFKIPFGASIICIARKLN